MHIFIRTILAVSISTARPCPAAPDSVLIPCDHNLEHIFLSVHIAPQAGMATWLLSLLTVQLTLTHPAVRKVTCALCSAGAAA
jgi:hypothetical protein